MDHYLDLTLLASPEWQEETVMATLFARLHLALVSLTSDDIGVSFPQHKLRPGHILRIHGAQPALKQLEESGWRSGFKEYCQGTDILPVPADTHWRTVSRMQVKSNPERLFRRSVRKGWLTEEQAQERLKTAKVQCCQLPYLRLKSLSSGHYFKLFIYHGELTEHPVAGKFTRYGLSQQATVPWFTAP